VFTSKQVIGVDIGGTSICVAAVDESGCVYAHEEFLTQAKAGFEPAVVKLAQAVMKVVSAANWSLAEVAAIGVGCTGPVDRITGTIHNPFTLPSWENKNIVTALEQATGKPVRLENDANAALIGEYRAGAGRGVDNVVMLTLGTGVGGGVLVKGCLYRGFDDSHPELGHIPVNPDGPECYCGQTGCLEILASGTALRLEAEAKGFTDGAEVFVEAARANTVAEEILDRMGYAISRAVGILAHTFLPERVILGGGVLNHENDLLISYVQSNLCDMPLARGNSVRIVPAQLGTRAGVVGAACLVLNGD
jgi:glucokinase